MLTTLHDGELAGVIEAVEDDLDGCQIVRVYFKPDAAQCDRIHRDDGSGRLVLEKIRDALLLEPVFEDRDLMWVVEDGGGDEFFHNVSIKLDDLENLKTIFKINHKEIKVTAKFAKLGVLC